MRDKKYNCAWEYVIERPKLFDYVIQINDKVKMNKISQITTMKIGLGMDNSTVLFDSKEYTNGFLNLCGHLPHAPEIFHKLPPHIQLLLYMKKINIWTLKNSSARGSTLFPKIT